MYLWGVRPMAGTRGTRWSRGRRGFLALGGLRLLQTETGSTFTDDWSWVPYLIMVVVLALGAAAVWLLRGAATNEEEAQ